MLPDENAVSPQIRAEIGRQLNGWLKREGTQAFNEAIGAALKEQMPALTENFLSGLAEELPSDEELNEMELQEAMEAGYDPESDMFYTPDGYPYDPATGELLAIDPETGEVYSPEEMAALEQQGYLPEEEMYQQDPRQQRYQRYDRDGMIESPTDPRMNAQIFQMRQELEALRRQNQELQQNYQTAEEQAESTDRAKQINEILAGIPFANDKAARQFRTYVEGNVFRLDDGTLVAGDPRKPLPLDKFVQAEIETSPHMVQSRQMGGSGIVTKPGQRPGTPTMEMIKPFQPKEERDAIIKQAVAALDGTGSL